jgi:hypothetical protein
MVPGPELRASTLVMSPAAAPVGDALAEDVSFGVLGVEVHRVGVAGDGGEQHDVGLGDGSCRSWPSAEPEVLEKGLNRHARWVPLNVRRGFT